MAIQSTTTWYIRVAGNNLNGGGYDPGIGGAGTNYADQDSPQLSLSDFACANSTTLTSATGGFTSAMVGNCIRIDSGTNFTAGYYFVTGYTDTNTVTLDRNPTNGSSASSGVGRLGGAFASLGNFWSGGSITQPSITSPLGPGHIVYMRGNGSNDPTSDDYTYSASDYSILPSGDTTNGPISIIGYNGRPRINYSGLMAYETTNFTIKNLYLKVNSSPGFPEFGFFTSPGSNRCTAINIKVDINGSDTATGLTANTILNCHITNTGTTGGGSGHGLTLVENGGSCIGCVVEKMRGDGINNTGTLTSIVNCLIVNNSGNGILNILNNPTFGNSIVGNTIAGNGGDGLNMTGVDSGECAVVNNIFSDNSGYGINFTSGSTSLNDKMKAYADYNVFYNNVNHFHNLSAGPNDQIDVNPQYANTASLDYTPTNMALKGTAFPIVLPTS